MRFHSQRSAEHLQEIVLVGSYSIPTPWAATPEGHGEGISAFRRTDGGFELAAAPHFEVNPSFLAQDQRHGRVWAVSELEHDGELLVFDIDDGGALVTPAARRVSTQSAAPCHVEVGDSVALVSHFHGGTVSVIPLDEHGLPTKVSEQLRSPEAGDGWARSAVDSRPHAAKFIPGSDAFAVADYGRDLVLLYRWLGSDHPVALSDVIALEPGTGPRHLAWHEGSRRLVVSNQNTGGLTVLEVLRDAEGEDSRLRLAQTVAGRGLGRTQPVPSEVAIHPDGNYAVLANRFDNSLTIYRISEDGALTEEATVDSGGATPRHFAFSPDGSLLLAAHQDSDELVVFEWSAGTCAHLTSIAIPTPTAVLFLAD